MLGGLLRRFSAPADAPVASDANTSVAAPAAADTVWHLAAPGAARLIDPDVPGGYAAMVNSAQGLFIINRNDTGVGWQLATHNAYMPGDMALMLRLVQALPPAPVILDVGANIGVVAVCLARAAGPEAAVHAFEPQRPMFHMLAGNAALNGLDNLHCHFLALGEAPGSARVPRLDYRAQASFGSLELNRERQSDLGQQARDGRFDEVPLQSIDALGYPRVDLIKIDVEGMEAAVLAGAAQTIARCKPLLYIEYLKSGAAALAAALDVLGYEAYDARDNFVCVPRGDARAAALMGGQAAWRAAPAKE